MITPRISVAYWKITYIYRTLAAKVISEWISGDLSIAMLEYSTGEYARFYIRIYPDISGLDCKLVINSDVFLGDRLDLMNLVFLYTEIPDMEP